MKAFSHSMRMISNFQAVRPLATFAPKRPFSQFKVNMMTSQPDLLLLSCKITYSLSLFDLSKLLKGGDIEERIKGK